MDTQEIILTRAGFEKLEEELAERKGARRAEIIELIKEARAQGDLSENAEYDAAREDQARNSEIEQILAVAKIAEGDSMSVSIGSKVEIEDERGKRLTFQIVGTTQTDSLNHLISNESPAGKAMIGHVAGDKVAFTTPSGKVREYTITSIEV